MRRGTVLVVAAATALAALAWAGPALALTPAQADAVALRALTPAKDRGNVALLGLAAALPAGTDVFEGGTRTAVASAQVAVAPLRAKAWAYWLDLAYGAKFQHPGKLVLVDDATGKVVSTAALRWWPLVGGRQVAWRTVWSAGGPPPSRSTSAAARPASRVDLPAGALADDCMLLIGHGSDPRAAQDFAGMKEAAAAIGLRATDVTTGDPDRAAGGAELAAAVKSAVTGANGCKDVLIYISGHGYASGPTGVNTGQRWTPLNRKDRRGRDLYTVRQAIVTSDDIAAIVRENAGRATFKLVVDACYSGRFVLDLPKDELPGLLVVEAASKADEVSWFHLGAVRYGNGTVKRSTTDNPGNNDPEKGRSEFTNGLIAGLRRFAAAPAEVDAARKAGGSLLARMLARAVTLGRADDFAATTGMTTPVGRLDVTPAQPSLPAAQLTAAITLSHHHLGPGASVVCGSVSTRAGATVEVKVHGNGGFSASTTVVADAAGVARFSFPISSYDTYTAGATVTRGGDTASAVAEHDVGPADATCP